MSSGVSNSSLPFVDRRDRHVSGSSEKQDRRQFANSYTELSAEAHELADAIDQYKFRHRRRFIDYEEMLSVIKELGYRKSAATEPSVSQ
jgi:NTP pyrophosphatase (non-canonical NTP hydrolase)